MSNPGVNAVTVAGVTLGRLDLCRSRHRFARSCGVDWGYAIPHDII